MRVRDVATLLCASCLTRHVESTEVYSLMGPPPSLVNTIAPDSLVTLHYRLAGPDGTEWVSTFDHRPATLSLGAGQLAPAIEARLIGLSEGSRGAFELPAGVAFGERNPDLVQRVAYSLLHGLDRARTDYKPGDVVSFPTPDGLASYAGSVQACTDDGVLFDFNHPLAGKAVTLEVEVIGVIGTVP